MRTLVGGPCVVGGRELNGIEVGVAVKVALVILGDQEYVSLGVVEPLGFATVTDAPGGAVQNLAQAIASVVDPGFAANGVGVSSTLDHDGSKDQIGVKVVFGRGGADPVAIAGPDEGGALEVGFAFELGFGQNGGCGDGGIGRSCRR